MRDFSLFTYRRLLQAIKTAGMPALGISEWLKKRPSAGVMLRHDVDRKPDNALKAAKLENDIGISSTYYFRITSSSFAPEIIREVFGLGHEIGYHYEDLLLAKGDYEKALKLFCGHLEMLRKLVPIKTIAMHGSPFSPYDNRDLWKKYRYGDFGVSSEAFLDVDYSDMYYFTDTGRTWGRTRANIRDTVKSNLTAAATTTMQLIDFVEDNNDEKIALVMHPERWEDDIFCWSEQLIKDLLINAAKCVISRFY